MRRLFVLLLLGILVPAVAITAAIATMVVVPHPIAEQSRRIEVKPGQSLRGTLRTAAAAGAIEQPRLTEWATRLSGGAAPKAGHYHLPARASDWQIVRMLDEGRVATVAVTAPEGLTVREIADLVEKAGVAAADEIVEAARDRGLLDRYGVPATWAEGYLFPETYRFAEGVGGRAVVEAMLAMFRARVPSDYDARAKAAGLGGEYAAVILASIIERETPLVEEMPRVSAVYHNRLRIGMRLQADPTAIYGMPGYDGNLTRRHLQTTTPWNTYRISGLPATPIANPGEQALLAAVEPGPWHDLYFVARGDGSHDFSTTYAEHSRKVERWQIRREGRR